MPPNAAEVARPQSPLRGIIPQSPLRIKQDGKFYERLLAKEASAANRSFRHYWTAEPGSVPFDWESQPGTPKDVMRMASGAVPAITPPPSYLLRRASSGSMVGAAKAPAPAASRRPQSKAKTGKTRYRFKRIKIGFIAGIFRRLTLSQAWRRSAPSVQASSSSSRWLFSSVATEKVDHLHHHEPAPRTNTELSTRPRPSPWMQRFRGFGSRSRDDVWA
ncbi:hypothetical protein GUJ93_ZPchr0001g31019 [Zizania palustris]|uniref:Uncharacterized protein n=1 Tax=Zizania palustris TaxID=103762 RepID=A0A8J5S4J9_ZIZPA|nr:hypothetical protein GUJ93_ZPchr0001g31019 [Zizania palustris]